jgi:hypothetical protein
MSFYPSSGQINPEKIRRVSRSSLGIEEGRVGTPAESTVPNHEKGTFYDSTL